MSYLLGTSFIGFSRGQKSEKNYRAFNPSANAPLEPNFYPASLLEADRACALAAEASPALAALSGPQKAAFLRSIALGIDAATPELIARATQETGLPEARCQGEIGRTMAQLRLFAELVEKGEWVDARIETANLDRKPAPKPDHRSLHRPIGPVAVFCASNFPFAYSVAGGDTASAFAAGCPVIVMAHHAHVGTAEIMAGIVSKAVRAAQLPEGTFSLLMGSGRIVGQHITQHPALRAIGFTGSRAGGRTLMDIAAARPTPIPVYAEMSSFNPIVILEGAITTRGDNIASGLFNSCTLGVGQFCTQPGVIILIKSAASESFVNQLSTHFAQCQDGVMLTAGIHQAYESGLQNRTQLASVKLIAQGKSSGLPNRAVATLFATEASHFITDASLQEEIFGPSSLIVWCANQVELDQVIQILHGNLTASIHGTEAELTENAALISKLESLAGRIVINGFPTGVEVSHAIVHGGPYPSLSDGRTTSVGSNAIYRFTRLVCFQNYPDAALPPELRNANPMGITRLVNGVRSVASL